MFVLEEARALNQTNVTVPQDILDLIVKASPVLDTTLIPLWLVQAMVPVLRQIFVAVNQVSMDQTVKVTLAMIFNSIHPMFVADWAHVFLQTTVIVQRIITDPHVHNSIVMESII